MNLCIQISRFPLSGSQGALRAERILQNTLNHDNLNIPQQVYRLSEKAVPPFRGKCTAYPPRCTAHSLGYDVKII